MKVLVKGWTRWKVDWWKCSFFDDEQFSTTYSKHRTLLVCTCYLLRQIWDEKKTSEVTICSYIREFAVIDIQERKSLCRINEDDDIWCRRFVLIWGSLIGYFKMVSGKILILFIKQYTVENRYVYKGNSFTTLK